MDLTTVGKTVCLGGLGVAALGGLLMLAGRARVPLGSLPGDVRLERPGFTLAAPIATSIVLSLVLTLVLNVVLRLLRR
jgi:hypothetical protein